MQKAVRTISFASYCYRESVIRRENTADGFTRTRRKLLKTSDAERYHTSLNAVLLILYSAIFAEILRRERPQIFAQRPMLPWLFLSALRMYCCSMSAVRSRRRSGRGRSRSMLSGVLGAEGVITSGGRFSGRIVSSREVTQAR